MLTRSLFNSHDKGSNLLGVVHDLYWKNKLDKQKGSIFLLLLSLLLLIQLLLLLLLLLSIAIESLAIAIAVSPYK